KNLFFYAIRDFQFIADLVSVMSVYNGTVPNNDGLPAALHHQIQLQLPVFLPPERSNQVFEFRIDPEFPKPLLFHIASCAPAVSRFGGKNRRPGSPNRSLLSNDN